MYTNAQAKHMTTPSLTVIMARANEDIPGAEDFTFLARGANVEEAKAALLDELNAIFDVYRYEITEEGVEGPLALAIAMEEMSDPFLGNERVTEINENTYTTLGFVIEEMRTGDILQDVLDEFEP